MVNWPGTHHRVRRDRLELERPRVGELAPPRSDAERGGQRAAGAASAAVAIAIHVEEPEPRPLEALGSCTCAKRDIRSYPSFGSVSHFAAQAGAVEAVARTARAPRVEVPAVRREEPRPADHLAGLERLDRDGAPRRDERLERDAAVAERRRSSGRVAVPEEQLALAGTGRSSRSPRSARAASASGPRTAGHRAGTSSIVSIAPSPRSRGWRPAPRSRRSRPGTRRCSGRSRRSPSVPNWSCHVPNLCVSHWR